MSCSPPPTQICIMSTFTKPKLKVTVCVSTVCLCVLVVFALCALISLGKKVREKLRVAGVLFCWVKGWEGWEEQSRGRERRMGRATSWLALLYSIVTAGALRLSVLWTRWDFSFFISVRLFRATVVYRHCCRLWLGHRCSLCSSKIQENLRNQTWLIDVCIHLVLQYFGFVWVSTVPALMHSLCDRS